MVIHTAVSISTGRSPVGSSDFFFVIPSSSPFESTLCEVVILLDGSKTPLGLGLPRGGLLTLRLCIGELTTVVERV